MVFKRYPFQRLYVQEIKSGVEVKGPDGSTQFFLEEEAIPRVRIVGIVTRVFHDENSIPKHSRIIVDDGTGVIMVKTWGEDRTHLLDINVGDEVDVLGKVKSFNNVFYIAPVAVRVIEDLNWELYHRALIIKNRLEHNMSLKMGANVNENILGISSKATSKELSKERIAFITQQLIEYLRENDKEAEFSNLHEKLGFSEEEVKEAIMNLLTSGEIYFPRPDIIKLT